jgi:hypothetical protein
VTEKIKSHLDSLFLDAPKTRKVIDMQSELLAGCLDKYADLTAGGMDGEEAYEKVIEGIGDVEELLGYIEKPRPFDPEDAAERRRKRAFFTSAGALGYFIAVAVFFLLATNGNAVIALSVMVIFSGIATMLLIYGFMSGVGQYQKADDTLVEEMKVKMTSGKKENTMASLASSALWSLIVAIYLLASFLTHRWDITWIIFPFAGGLQNLVAAYFSPDLRMKLINGAFWCFVVTAYLMMSFWSHSWHITWIIFPCAVAVKQAAKLFIAWRENDE